jgi:hypothetical protein
MSTTTNLHDELTAEVAAIRAQADADAAAIQARIRKAQQDADGLLVRQQEPRRLATIEVARETLDALDEATRHEKSRLAFEAGALDPNVGADQLAALWQTMRADEASRAATVRAAADHILDVAEPLRDANGDSRDTAGNLLAPHRSTGGPDGSRDVMADGPAFSVVLDGVLAQRIAAAAAQSYSGVMAAAEQAASAAAARVK